jgi:hypothetical protein
MYSSVLYSLLRLVKFISDFLNITMSNICFSPDNWLSLSLEKTVGANERNIKNIHRLFNNINEK